MLKVYYSGLSYEHTLYYYCIDSDYNKVVFLESLEDGKDRNEGERHSPRGSKKAIAIMTKVPSLEYGEMAH